MSLHRGRWCGSWVNHVQWDPIKRNLGVEEWTQNQSSKWMLKKCTQMHMGGRSQIQRQGYNGTATQVSRWRMSSLPLLLFENDTDTYKWCENLKLSVESPRLSHTLTSLSFSPTLIYSKKVECVNIKAWVLIYEF